MNTFRLQLAGLDPGRTKLRLEGSTAELGLEAAQWPSPAVLEIDVDRNGDQFTVRGRLQAVAHEECSRCLSNFELPVDATFTILADRGSEDSPAEELDVDDYLMYHDGRVLDLDQTVREQLVLSRPMLSLCRPDCAGLCPHCGANLNEGICRCAPGDVERPPTADPATR